LSDTDAGRGSNTTELSGGMTGSRSSNGSNPVRGDSSDGVINGSSGGGLGTPLTRDDIPVLVREITAQLRPDAQPLIVPGMS